MIPAFLLPILLFLGLGSVGCALLALLHSRTNLLRTLLLSPVLGCLAVVISAFMVNRAGLPVRNFAWYLAGLWGLFAIVTLWWRKPKLPMRRFLPFAGIFILALVLTGRPLLDFGYHWLSYSNDDMANYVLAADRFLNNGFFDPPAADDLLFHADITQYFWFMHAAGGARPGSELLLAWTAALTGRKTAAIFMPVMLFLHLCLISSSCAMLLGNRRNRAASLLFGLLLAFSPIVTLGTLYQLIAQVFGLALFCALVVFLFRRFTAASRWSLWRDAALAGAAAGGLWIVYPEVVPFLAVSFLLYVTAQIWQRQLCARALVKFLAGSFIVMVIVTFPYLFGAVLYLASQSSGGLGSQDVEFSVFPYYLIPSGFANLWGLLPVSVTFPEPFLSISVAVAAALLLWTFHSAWSQFLAGYPHTYVFFVMAALGTYSLIHRLDFALFKLAMYIQPFMLACLAVGNVRSCRRPRPS